MGEPPDVWVAIFTMVLGGSTIGLWIATHKSAQAATRAAEIAERALVDLEAPSVFLEVDQEFNEITTANPGAMGGSITSKMKIPAGWYFCFVNYGRTPAFLITVKGVIEPAMTNHKPAAVDENTVAMPRGAVVPPGGKSKKFIMDLKEPPTGPPEAFFLTICCRFSDIFNNEYLAGFSYVLRDEALGFRLTEFKDGYNYLTLAESGNKKEKT